MAETTKKTRTMKSGKRAKATGNIGAVRKKAAGRKAAKVKTVRRSKSGGKPKRDSRMALGRGWRISPDGGKTEFPRPW